MTIDDDKSIYVGGLPYDITEDTFRRAFDLYGAVVAVKIHNDRELGGKCYGFVTFKNPRSAVDAINDMDGREIGGRSVRVNEVRPRDEARPRGGGGRSNFGRGITRRDNDRGMDLDRDRDRGRDRGRDLDRERYRDRNDRSRDHDPEWEIEDERPRGYDRSRDPFPDRDQVQSRDREYVDQEVSRKHDRDRQHSDPEVGRRHDRVWIRDRGVEHDPDREVDIDDDRDRRDKDQLSKSRNSSRFLDRRNREISSSSSEDYEDEVKEQLELSIQRREELQKEISQIDGKLEKKQQIVSDLQKKSQKLEDALASTKKLSSQRRMQMSKFQKYILQVKDYSEKLKKSEQGLQSLVDTVMSEIDDVDDAIMWDDDVDPIAKG